MKRDLDKITLICYMFLLWEEEWRQMGRKKQRNKNTDRKKHKKLTIALMRHNFWTEHYIILKILYFCMGHL